MPAMDAWTLTFVMAVSLVCMVMAIRYRGSAFAAIGGIISLWGLANLIYDNGLTIAHECCDSLGNDIPIPAPSGDLLVIYAVLAAFIAADFAMLIEANLGKDKKEE